MIIKLEVQTLRLSQGILYLDISSNRYAFIFPRILVLSLQYWFPESEVTRKTYFPSERMQRQEMRTDYRDYIASAHNCRESWQSGIVFADNGPRRIVWQLALAIAMDPGVDLAISLYYYLWWHANRIQRLLQLALQFVFIKRGYMSNQHLCRICVLLRLMSFCFCLSKIDLS